MSTHVAWPFSTLGGLLWIFHPNASEQANLESQLRTRIIYLFFELICSQFTNIFLRNVVNGVVSCENKHLSGVEREKKSASHQKII